MLKISKLVTLILIFIGLGYSAAVMATAPVAVPLTTISKTVDTTVAELATVLVDISLIAGIGFILASFFKFHQHKQNPQQVQMSQGISLLLIGCGLTLIPLLIPTASVAVLGTAANKPAQLGGTDIHALIGDGSTQ